MSLGGASDTLPNIYIKLFFYENEKQLKTIKVACRVRVAYLKEENHQFFTVFLNKFLKHVFNTILKLNNHT